MADIEIEAPSATQKADAMTKEVIEFAETGADEVNIISKMMAKGIPREEAERLLPSVLEAAKRKRGRKSIVSKVIGLLLTVGGFGSGIVMLIGGLFWVWPFLLGILGIAILTKYMKVSDL